VAEAGDQVWETIVSDDGTDPRTDEVIEEFKGRIPNLRLIRGPRLGHAANRNSCVAQAAGDYLTFLDDDARLGEEFISHAMRYAREDTLVTGFYNENSIAIRPNSLDFLGFMRRPPSSHSPTISMIATIFPIRFLRQTGFDEFFRYGYEEAEIALAAVHAGMTILHVEAANWHDQALERGSEKASNVIRSRAYLGVRRYRDYEPNLFRLGLFAVLGLLNATGAGIRSSGAGGGIQSARSFTAGLLGAASRPSRRRYLQDQPDSPAPKISVVVPTWQRPSQLRACLEGIFHLDPLPDQVVVVRRREDGETALILSALSSEVDECVVDEPGVVAALEAGARRATGDIVAFTDDDAVPRSDWLNYLLRQYRDPRVGAVGGRDIIHNERGIVQGATRRVGTISPFGRVAGGHHLGVGAAREVAHLKGVNMSFRRSLLCFPVGFRGEGAQVFYELAMCLAVRRDGWKVVYDPRAQVDHYPGERFDEDSRTSRTRRAAANATFNQSFTLFSLQPRRRLVRLAYMLLVGDRCSPGLVRALVARIRGETQVTSLLLTSLRAQWEAWQAASRAPLVLHEIAEEHAPSRPLVQSSRRRTG
jgi:GT2 family glycosyltransferase